MLRRQGWVVGLLAVGVAQSALAQPQATGLPAGAVARLGHTQLRHADKPTCVAFAPDGTTFVTGGDDGTVRKWSVTTGEQVAILQKPGMTVSALTFTQGGKRLVAQIGSDGVSLDAATLRETGTTRFVGRHRFDFSPDGTFMATSDFDDNLTVVEVANALPKLELANAPHFAFQPDGKAIAIGDAKGNVTVHRLTGGKPTFHVKLAGAIAALSYSPNGRRLAIGTHGADGADTIRVFDGTEENPVVTISGVGVPKAWIGTNALACGSATQAGVYDVAKKQWTRRIEVASTAFAISADGTKLATIGTGLRVRLWNLTTGKQMHAENDSFPEPALLVGSADGRDLFILSSDTAYRWTIGETAAKPAGTLPGRAIVAAVGGGKLIVATPEAIHVYAKFDLTKPLPDKPTSTFKDSAGAKAVAIAADGSRVAWAIAGGKVTITDVGGQEARRELPTTTMVFALGFNPSGARLAAEDRDPYLRVWDVSRRDEVKEVWKARIPRGIKGAVAFSPNGKLLTAVSTPQLAVFDATDGRESSEPREPLYRGERTSDDGALHHAAFSPDGRLLVVGSAGMSGRVEVWDVTTHSLIQTFTTSYGGTSRLCVFPNGARIASAGAEEAITVWDVRSRGDKPPPKAEEPLKKKR